MPSVQFTGFITAAVLFVGLLEGAESSADDEILKAVHKHLYTAREDAIRLLEGELKQDPGNLTRWVSLIYALNVNGEKDFAERAARLSLQTHPDNPELLIARAKVLGEEGAWDQLDDLGKRPGLEARSVRLKELLGLQLLGNYDERQSPEARARFQGVWAQRLLERGLFENVPKVVFEGLTIQPEEPTLLALLPVAHALAERYDEALQEHAKQDFQQKRCGQFVCLGDCMLFKRQPKRAIASFNGKTPDDAALRNILAIAHARLGDYGQAEELVGKSPVDDLLRICWDLDRSRDAEIKQGVPELLARHCRRGPGSWNAPRYAALGGTVGEECSRAILWLGREFPNRKAEIYEAFGLADPQSEFRQAWLPAADVQVSARRYVAWLRDKIPTDLEEFRAPMRRRLSELLAQQQQYTAAAEALIPNVIANSHQPDRAGIDDDAVTWSLLIRRAEAEKLHQSDPWTLVQARQLLAEIHCRKWNCGRMDRKPWREAAEVIPELRKLPSGTLAAVLEELKPKVISAADRTPYVAVIEHLGTLSDSPVLISALAMASRIDSGGLSSEQLENDRRSADALHACLLKLSGVQAPSMAQLDRLAFWSDWWRTNCRTIVEGMPKR